MEIKKEKILTSEEEKEKEMNERFVKRMQACMNQKQYT